MSNFWISWYSDDNAFELHSPWWRSGFELGEPSRDIFCAAVKADNPQAAQQLIYSSFDTVPASIEFRFTSEQPENWSPFSDRFPQAKWMAWDKDSTCTCGSH